MLIFIYTIGAQRGRAESASESQGELIRVISFNLGFERCIGICQVKTVRKGSSI